MDDYGNALHWTDMVRGFASLGIYGWCDQGLAGLVAAVDFSELDD